MEILDNQYLIDILQSLYENTQCSLHDLIILVHSGVRQGGGESPFLFNLYLDFVMRVFVILCDKHNIDFVEL